MYKRYIGYGTTAKESLLFCKMNRLAYSKKINKFDITSRTNIIFMDTIKNETDASMEQMLIFAYFYNLKKNNDFSETEYKYYKKLIIAFGKAKLNKIFENFSSTDSCIGIKHDHKTFRIIYFTK